MNFIDTHCHILPGMDDGPSNVEESLRMAEMALQDGISHIFATPHMLEGLYDNSRSKIISSVDHLRRHLPDEIELLCGADVRVTIDLQQRIESGEIMTLNNTGYLLLELPDYIVPLNFDNLVYSLRRRGVTPIITHPERHARLMRDLPTLGELRDSGALCQITAMSITGDFGKEIWKACFAMMKKGLVDFVASDAHNADRRPPVLSKAYSVVKREFGNDIADRIFFDNPGKILEAGHWAWNGTEA